MRRFGLAVVLVSTWLLACVGPSWADDFELPGLSADARAYVNGLEHRHPAGGTPQQKRAAEQVAATALAKHDYVAAANALEERAALGAATAQQWLDLATAHIKKSPPDAKRALDAAWQAFSDADGADKEIPPLLVMVDALKALDRADQAVIALQAVVERAPDDAGYTKQLADLQRQVGLTVSKVRVEGEADPARACIAFSVPPAKRDGFVAQDWVRVDPPVPGVAVTREDDEICVSGLPSGRSSRIVLRAGLPGEQGLTMTHETALVVAVPNRTPAVIFDSRFFILPRGQAPSVSMSTVNLSTVAIKLLRITERNTATLLRDTKLGTQVEDYIANQIADSYGSVVWEGKADVPAWQPNVTARTALPLPDALLNAGPGLYALQVTAGDGTPGDASATQLVLRTDLAPTVWRGSDGLTVQVRGYTDAAVRAGVRLVLLARNNDVLGETTTDAQGVGHFPVALLHGDGPLAPAVLHAFAGDSDFAVLDLNVAAFDLSDRGVAGAPHPGPLDSYVWLDRGIYRPGETVQVMAMLRDNAGAPIDIPARVTVKRPNGQVFLTANPPRTAENVIYVPVTLTTSAPVGTWTVEVRADPAAPPIGQAEFRVDAFVPDRMAVDIGPAPAALIPNQEAAVPVVARFLYGAPGAYLSGKATMRLSVDPSPFPALAGYRVGLVDEIFTPDNTDIDVEDTDAEGRTSVPVKLDKAPDTTRPVRADITAEINDPSGHGSKATTSIPVRSANPFIGIKPLFAENAIDADSEAAFDVIAVAPDGARINMAAKLRLIRERPNWRLVRDGQLARYQTVWRDEPLETKDVTIGTDTPLHVAQRLPFGRYRIEVAQAGGMAITSYRFRSGWVSSDSPDVPDRVDVSTDRKSIPAGENARIHIAAPFAGEATLAVLSDRVHSLRTLSVPEGGMDVDVPVEASWGPGAYVAVHVFRGGGKPGAPRPDRAIGLVWVGIDPSARTLPMAITAPDKTTPRGVTTVSVKTTPGAWVTLATVDEGILRLTDFKSPDPAPHFLGRRTLAIDIRDDWGRLIAPAEGAATELHQGGDDGSFVLPDIPQHTVTLFTPPMQAGPDGVASIPLDLPDFNGQVRLMAVGWQGTKIGSANLDVIVRDALVAEPLLPRFLAPGDQARMAVLLNNLDLPAGDAAVKVSVEGPLAVAGASTLGANLAVGQQVVAATVLRATGAGRGVIHLDVTGPQGFHVMREAAITIRPSRGAVTQVAASQLAPGMEAALAVSPASFIAGTMTATATFGAPVRYDVAALTRALDDYAYRCLEQSVSRGLPLAMLPDGPLAGADRAGRLQVAVSGVLDKQRYDGGFALWSSSGEAEPWLSSYAVEFLIRARKAGALVPDPAMTDAIKFLTEATEADPDSPEDYAAQAYRLYVLALSGHGRPGLVRVLAEQADRLPTPLARAQLAAALAMAHDQPGAEAAFAQALSAPARRWWHVDYGSSLRDAAAMTVLLKESGLAPDRLTRLAGTLPGADLAVGNLSTQELAWTAAAAASLGRDGAATHVAIDGQAEVVAPIVTVALTKGATAKNVGDKPVWQSVAVRGVPVQAPPAARNGMRVTRKFLALDGSPLNLDQLKQNTNFVLLLEGQSEDGQDHQAMVMQGLPAGWEIAGRMESEKVPGMDWLGDLSATESEPAGDDRFAAVIDLTGQKSSFRVAVRLRAVTPGDYELPGAELTDMYRPTVFARQGANRIKVLAPE